jgi:hypothetical protein
MACISDDLETSNSPENFVSLRQQWWHPRELHSPVQYVSRSYPTRIIIVLLENIFHLFYTYRKKKELSQKEEQN